MSDTYDVQHFELDYCQDDVSKIVAAIQSRTSLLVVGMPGCGKSRLIDFLLHRPGVLENYGLSDNLKFIRVDGDMVIADPEEMYSELLRALGHDVQALGESSPDALKNRLIAEFRRLEPDIDLVVIFDNFTLSLQQALGENFFSFLFALRNSRQKLNVIYIFAVNLKIDFAGFYKLNRLFDQGADRSICWLSLLNRKDSFSSIDRQLRKAGQKSDRLSDAHKEKIYEMAGGHPLLTRYLTHLMLSGDSCLLTQPEQALTYGGIRAACQAIWDDVEQRHKNFLIEVATRDASSREVSQPVKLLLDYGILEDEAHFFSPLFESFVKLQKKTRTVIDAHCDDTQPGLIVSTIDKELSFAIHGLSQRQRNLLCYLLENHGETCPKDQLIEVGWPSDYKGGVTDQALSRQIDRIRNWLKQPAQLSQYMAIETVWGEGYRLALKE